jgi:hypothetical protein
VPKSEKNLKKIDHILGDEGHGMLKKLILEFLEEPNQNTLSIARLDALIKKLDDVKFTSH